MVNLPVTSMFAAIFAIALVALSLWVTLRRVAVKAEIGDGADGILRTRIRVQGNFIEYVPLAVVCLALLEGAGAPAGLIWGLGGVLAAGRVLHATGMIVASIPLRVVGMVLTYGTLLAAAWRLAVNAVGL